MTLEIQVLTCYRHKDVKWLNRLLQHSLLDIWLSKDNTCIKKALINVLPFKNTKYDHKNE
jgi:hypothetical protein